jgi:hypothetical protein
VRDYYDRDGTSLTLEQWVKAYEGLTKKAVASTLLPDGTWISTVWLGINHQYGEGPPLIFETMVFPGQGQLAQCLDWRHYDRYATEAEALAGHEAMVRKVRAKL